MNASRMVVVAVMGMVVAGCGGQSAPDDPRLPFEGSFTGRTTFDFGSGDTGTITGQTTEIFPAQAPTNIIISSPALGSLGTVIATVSDSGFTYPEQSSVKTTSTVSETVTVSGGSGTFGGNGCEPLVTPGLCLEFSITLTDTTNGGPPQTAIFSFSGNKD